MGYKTVIGVGQTGTRIAQLFAKKKDVLLTFNTDHKDSMGSDSKSDHIVVEGGAGQNYSRGLKIWSDNRDKLQQYFEPVWDQDVIYFTAGGGGSGSSSVITFLNILLQQNNRVLLVLVLPFIRESIPATSNAVRVMNRVAEFSNNMSVFILSNDDISKEVGESYTKINNFIVEKTRMITDLTSFHDEKSFTPFAIDDTDHRSVAFSGGFMNISYTNLEEFMGVKGPILPKFSYGNIKEASNVLISKILPTRMNQEKAMEEGDKLLKVAKKIGSSAKSARILHGIIRSNDNIPSYITFATGLSVDKIFDKMKVKATNSALRYVEKTKTKETRKLERSEDKLLDI